MNNNLGDFYPILEILGGGSTGPPPSKPDGSF